MEDFEPPKYMTSLIAAVNDGAKSAQAGAFLFLLVGLYLLATAFSASDEDLLLGRTVTISQIGASLPVSFSFAIAPMVFVFLHIYTLVRYDLLAANVRQFQSELHNTVRLEADRERCRQLLANVEFIVELTTPRSSALYSRLWLWLSRGIVTAFPVTALLLVQINALRYQSDLIVWVQRVWLVFDLVALVWFFRRNALDGSVWPERRLARAQRWAWLLLGPVVVGALNLLYLDTVPVDADQRLVRYDPQDRNNPKDQRAYAVGNPLDLILCPRLKWGCRFLRVDHRTLVDQVRDDKALGILRMDISQLAEVLAEETTGPGSNPDLEAKAERVKAMAAIEGAFLRNRSLRFAILDESRLYAADLIEADLRSASLSDADISGARLRGALLRGSNLTAQQLGSASRDLREADLPRLNLVGAQLQGANLNDANVRASYLSRANLNRAELRDADLSGADLRLIDLSSADLSRANLSGANLNDANLSDADLNGADLDRSDLSRANLSGADLSRAYLNRADLNHTDLSAAHLMGAHLEGAVLVEAHLEGAILVEAHLEHADLSRADLSAAKNLIQAQLDGACGTDVKLPPGLTLRPCP
jgi:uncharacterized protein YjbI with pentapeptide repeats